MQRRRQVADLGPVEVRQAGVQPQCRRFGALVDDHRQLKLLAFQLRHPLLHAGLIHAILHCRHDAADLLVDLGKLAACLLPDGIGAGCLGVEGAAVFFNEGGDEVRVQ
ncbi:hypothetical protein [Yoonia sp. 72]|uniref:hypothetical protein n=1 Tax=Yoonia sp. 72 TaxID=3081450 RepID=UPI002AFEE192|nr:hypothetical protein [Yoonia sp. 72]